MDVAVLNDARADLAGYMARLAVADLNYSAETNQAGWVLELTRLEKIGCTCVEATIEYYLDHAPNAERVKGLGDAIGFYLDSLFEWEESGGAVITESQRKALLIVKEHPGIAPREFAAFMWPDSDGWSTHTRCGPYGVTHGGGMNLAGGGYLGKLAAKGFVYRSGSGLAGSPFGYKLTGDGERALALAQD